MKEPLGRVFLTISIFISTNAFSANTRPPDLLPVPNQPVQSDPLISKMWHLSNSGALEAWKKVQGSYTTKIAVIDSGIDYNHPDLATNIFRKQSEFPLNGQDKDGNGFKDDIIGWDFVKSTFLPFDKSGHGTFMASIIAGRKDNGVGGAGVCPSCSLMAVRFINAEGLGDTEDAIEGIYYAANEGASVINISFAGEGYDRDLEKAIEYAGSKNSVVVVSASNDDEDLDKASTYPAKFQKPYMLTIGASNQKDELMKGSNWGKKTVSMLAPGEEILGIWNGKYDTGSGTSQAAAVVSGVVGLVRSANPKLSNEKAVQIVRKTVRKVVGHEKHSQEQGIVDANAAVQCAFDPKLSCL